MMPDKQKAIEEMTEAIPYDIIRYDQKPKGQHLYWEQRKEIAVALVNANYGSIPQALTEFAERLDKRLFENGFKTDLHKAVISKTLKEFLSNANIPE